MSGVLILYSRQISCEVVEKTHALRPSCPSSCMRVCGPSIPRFMAGRGGAHPPSQADSDLLGLVRSEYPRTDDEGRTLIQSALKGSGNLEVTDNELRVTLNPLSSPHRSKAIGTLCEKLNTTNTLFPGSKLRLVYGVKEHAHVTQK